jgi:hypothetical protein
VNRNAIRHQTEAVVTPMLARGELLRRAGPVWAVEHRGRTPLLFRARHPHLLALTDQRMILFARPRRRRPLSVNDLVIAKRYSAFTPVHARVFRPLLQLRLRTSADRVLVLEFRPLDRALAHDLVDELGPADDDAIPRSTSLVTDEDDLADLLRQ